jgi:hypothetical protein
MHRSLSNNGPAAIQRLARIVREVENKFEPPENCFDLPMDRCPVVGGPSDDTVKLLVKLGWAIHQAIDVA